MRDRSGEAYTLLNMGAAYNSLGEFQKALESLHQALPLLQAVKDQRREAGTLLTIGGTYTLLGEYQKALDHFSQALSLSRALRDFRGEAYTLNNLGKVYEELGEKQKVLEYYTQAIPPSQTIGDRRGETAIRNNIGAVYEELGERQKARDFYDQALQLWRAVQDRYGEASALNNLGRVYDGLGEKQKALEYYGQALSLHRDVGNRRGEASTLCNVGLVYHSLEDQQKALDAYSQALQISQTVGDRGTKAAALYSLARLERDRDNLVEAQTHPEAALDILESTRTKVTSQELRASFLATKQTTKLLAGKRQMIIVPDGILYYLPFEVLLTSGTAGTRRQRGPGQWPYVVRDHAVSYVPSASILASLRDQRPQQPKPSKMFLAFADPAYSGTEPAAVRSFGLSKPWELKPLPYSREEVERIARLYPQDQVAMFVGTQASEENVKAEDRLAQYRYIHFSVHGLLNESEPQYAGLVLSLPEVEKKEGRSQGSEGGKQKAEG